MSTSSIGAQAVKPSEHLREQRTQLVSFPLSPTFVFIIESSSTSQEDKPAPLSAKKVAELTTYGPLDSKSSSLYFCTVITHLVTFERAVFCVLGQLLRRVGEDRFALKYAQELYKSTAGTFTRGSFTREGNMLVCHEIAVIKSQIIHSCGELDKMANNFQSLMTRCRSSQKDTKQRISIDSPNVDRILQNATSEPSDRQSIVDNYNTCAEEADKRFHTRLPHLEMMVGQLTARISETSKNAAAIKAAQASPSISHWSANPVDLTQTVSTTSLDAIRSQLQGFCGIREVSYLLYKKSDFLDAHQRTACTQVITDHVQGSAAMRKIASTFRNNASQDDLARVNCLIRTFEDRISTICADLFIRNPIQE